MVAGNWVLTGDGDVMIAPNHESVEGSPDDLGRVVVAASGKEIETLLSGGFDAWKDYRDEVLGEA